MKTFTDIKTQVGETLTKDIREIVEHLDGRSFRGVGQPNDFGRGGYDDPHHLSGRGQLLDVLIRKLTQLGVENDPLAREVAERLGLDLGGGGIQKLLKLLKCHALGLTNGDLPSHSEKDEVLSIAAQVAQRDMADFEERPLAPEGSELTRAPSVARRPPNQPNAIEGDPLGYSNQGNLRINEPEEVEFDEEAVLDRMREMKEHYGLSDLPDLQEDDLQEDKTDRELKLGLKQWITDARAARKARNKRLATEIRRNIMQVVALRGLDAQRITSMLDEGVDPGFVVRLSLEEDVTPILRRIVDKKQAAQIKFDDGKRLTVDLYTASAMIAVHDALKKPGQEKFRRMASKNKVEFTKIANLSYKHTGGTFTSSGPVRVV